MTHSLEQPRRIPIHRDYSVESNNEVKMTRQEIIEMIHRAGSEV